MAIYDEPYLPSKGFLLSTYYNVNLGGQAVNTGRMMMISRNGFLVGPIYELLKLVLACYSYCCEFSASCADQTKVENLNALPIGALLEVIFIVLHYNWYDLYNVYAILF